MQLLSPLSPIAAAILLAPAWGFAAMTLMGDAPGEWARGALLGWTALAAALIAGAGLQAAGGVVPWAALVLAFAAVMIGGPPGLGVAAVAVASFLLTGQELPVPWWLVAALAVPPAGLALRYALAARRTPKAISPWPSALACRSGGAPVNPLQPSFPPGRANSNPAA